MIGRVAWHRTLAALIAGAVLVSGCGSSDPSVQPSGGTNGSATDATDVAATDSSAVSTDDEATVTGGDEVEVLSGPLVIGLESAGSSASIGPDGGSVEVTGSDGTGFVLDVPAGALWEQIEITAIPVASFGNLGFDAAGVVFAPPGLSFIETARLTITPPEAIPVEQQQMFSFSDDGTQFGVAEPQLDTADVVIMVQHFSGYGVGTVTEAGQAAFLKRQASDAAARISSEVGEILSTERVAQVLGQESEVNLGELFVEASKDWEEQVIKPAVAVAGSSCAAGKTAIQTVLAHERQKALLGSGEGSLAGLIPLFQQVYKVCEKEAIEKCKAAKDPAILFTFWLGASFQSDILGAGFAPTPDLDKAKSICIPSYVASGGSEVAFSGTIEDLAAPFALSGAGQGFTVDFSFTPTSPTAGALDYSGSGEGITMEGSGTYTITGADPDPLTLTYTATGCVNVGGCRTTTNAITLTLTAG